MLCNSGYGDKAHDINVMAEEQQLSGGTSIDRHAQNRLVVLSEAHECNFF